jgi:hypothetical protein
MDDFSPIFLYIAYPKARIGSADPGWITQEIDGAPVTYVATGSQAALAFDTIGMGFISYLQEVDYELPDIKIAFQLFRVLLPIVTNP